MKWITLTISLYWISFDSPALERFTMQGSDLGAEMPTFTNNRTWLSLEGHLISQELTTTPDCLCGE